VVCLDESGFMLQPTVRRTWAPRGETPVLDCWDRHDRLSVISAITVSPRRKRLGLYFDIFDHNIVTDDFETFVASLLQRLGRPIILVMDRWPVHRSGAGRLQERFGRRVCVEWLPAYAPELNPDEQVWNHTKYTDLANFIPDDTLHLGQSVAQVDPRHPDESKPVEIVLPTCQTQPLTILEITSRLNRIVNDRSKS
jgi:transposase